MRAALRDDALTTTPTGFRLRVGLPWIRSLPVACLRAPAIMIDGIEAAPLVVVGGRRLAPDEVVEETTWWFSQDRLVLDVDRPLTPGAHDVVVTFRLLIPYLMAGPGGGPLELPIRLTARLQLDHDPIPSVSLDVA